MKFLDISGLKTLISEIKKLLIAKADKTEIPKKVGELENDSNFISSDSLPKTWGDLKKGDK